MALTRFAKYSWFVLVYNLMVVVYGAFVRASGSGAGCGAHWPLCNGVIIPTPQRIETLIEFIHRLMSGLTLILVAALVVWAWRQFPRGSLLRKSAGFALFFTITEALVGAGLVLFQLVGMNDSIQRAAAASVHLVNTFLLIGSLAITAWWSSTGEPERVRLPGVMGWLLIVGVVGILTLGASGAITALGDTLYPSTTLAQGVQQDFNPAAHLLTRVRIYHPMIAISVGVYLFAVTYWIRRKQMASGDPRVERITTALFWLFLAQLLLGMINVVLQAPIWLQLIHLLVSDLVWLTFVLMTTVIFGGLNPAAGVGDHAIHHPVNQAAD